MVKDNKKQVSKELYDKWNKDIEKLIENSKLMSWSSIEKKSGYNKLSSVIKESQVTKDMVNQVQHNCITYMGVCEAIREMQSEIEEKLSELTKEEYKQAFDFLSELIGMQEGAEITADEKGHKVAQLSKKQTKRLEEMHKQSKGFRFLDSFLKNVQTADRGTLHRIERQIDSFEKGLKVVEKFFSK